MRHGHRIRREDDATWRKDSLRLRRAYPEIRQQTLDYSRSSGETFRSTRRAERRSQTGRRTGGSARETGASSMLGRNQARANRVAHQPGNIVNIEPVHELLAMRFHRLLADVQLVRDFLGAESGRDQRQNL